jgi:phosphatidylglycerol lysyltransferase
LKSELKGILSALKRAAIFTVGSTVIACGAFLLLAIHEHRPFHFLPVILETLRHIYSLPSDFEPLRHVSLSHQIGRSLLFILGVTNYLLIAFALAKPVIDKFRLTTYDHARVWRLLRRYAKSSEDYFKYWPADKSYFFGKKTDGFIAYGVHQNICIAVANPIGPDPAKLIDEFSNYCATQGWQQVFVPVDELHRSLYKAKKFRSIKIGDCALIDLKQFSLETSQTKNMRNITNRFTKKNYRVGFMTHPYDFTSLRQVSDAWLSNGRQERSFLMGYFDTTYLNKSRIFTLHDPSNKLIGFINIQPNYSQTRSSIDLMRMSPDAASNAMDFLLSQLFTVLHQEGWQQIDIGLAPFSGLDTSRASERTLHLLYTYANRLFAFKGLRRFKDKYQPTWEPQYLMYRGASSNLPQIAIALNALMKYK